MLYNNNSKSKIGGTDPFNKKKLEDEAKRSKEAREQAQKQQEKSKLQMQIGNLKRESDKLTMDLRTKESLLSGVKRKLEDAKRAIFLLEGEMKKQEGGVGYLSQQAQSDQGRYTAQEAELLSIKQKQNSVVAEINKLKKEIAERESALMSKNIENEKLELSYQSIDSGLKQVENEKSRLGKDIQAKEREKKENQQEIFFKKRVVEQLERDEESMSREVNKIKQDKDSKEKEIDDFERKRDAIG